ncbi:MAG: hypothetical protein M3081_07320 [Gemmatimonadota bacterium]|nr:hypothetical protein [Gemmatimonadota bacterium]
MPKPSPDLPAGLDDRPPAYTVRMHGVSIGFSSLSEADAASRVARGDFRAGLGFELVQPIFRLYAEAMPRGASEPNDRAKLQRFQRARQALALELVSPAGRVLETESILILDYDDGRELEASISDPKFWENQS